MQEPDEATPGSGERLEGEQGGSTEDVGRAQMGNLGNNVS